MGANCPEAVQDLPLGLCCVCLRKLHWMSQVDLLDRYSQLPPVLSKYFVDETEWLWKRMVVVGMPTYSAVQDLNPIAKTSLKWQASDRAEPKSPKRATPVATSSFCKLDVGGVI